MKFLADENIDLSIVRALRGSGHEVSYVAEKARGISDDEVLEMASREGALLLTGDKDFGELVFRQGRTTAGVLLMRLAGVSSLEKASLVTETVHEYQDELSGTFAVLTPTALRVRKREPPA